MLKLRKLLSTPSAFFFLTFLLYCILTLIIFYHRLPHITTEFAMPDVDTDGGLWYQWYIYYTKTHNLLPEITNLFVYPFGYDLTFVPFSNLIYSIQLFFLEHVTGFSWSNLVLVTNISSLITYPLSGIGAVFLSYYVTKNKWSSFIAGIIYAFSFYHIYMGRGEMSINHIEFIPFYILSLLYFLDKKELSSLLLSAVIFSLNFTADPYYAFFSGIFSALIVAFYTGEKITRKITTGIIYYTGLFTIMLLTNLSFILSNLYLFDKVQLIQTGRNSIPKNELVNIIYYFSKITENNFNFLYHYVGPISYFLQILPIIVAVIGLIIIHSSETYRKYLLFFTCFLLAIVLSSYNPSLYFINILYFKFFGMFRGVSRIIMPASLFLGLLVGMVIQYLMMVYKKTTHVQRNIFLLSYFLFIIMILLSALNTDPTWMRNTDFSKLAKLYEPIKNNNNIHVIATYPMTNGDVIAGCPQGYQFLGQIIHNKTFACGASPFSKEAIEYYKSISDITNQNTIPILSKYHVDTLFIANNILANAKKENEKLRNDPRISYIGTYTQQVDKGYLSTNDMARNISVYQIKSVVEENKHPRSLLSSEGNVQLLGYKKIDPYRYVIHLRKNGDGLLVFDSPFSNKWVLLNGDLANANVLSLFNRKSEYVHSRYNDYANSWKIPNNKQGDFYITLYFAPQPITLFANLIRIITFITCFIIIVLTYFKIVYTRMRKAA